MLVVSLIAIIKGGLFSGYMKRYASLYEDGVDGKPVAKSDASEEDVIKLAIHSIWVVLIGIAVLVVEFIFLVSALSVDIFIIPTALILTVFIGKTILIIAGKKKNKKTVKELTTDTKWNKVRRFLFLLYIIYIFILVLI